MPELGESICDMHVPLRIFSLQIPRMKYYLTVKCCRGVTEQLGEYLRHLIYDKEQREYMAWLKKVRDFVQ
jgi:hypothetical protein